MKRNRSAACRVNVINLSAIAFATLTLAAALITGCSTNKTLEPNSPDSAFDRADANHNGKLSLDELNEFVVNEIFDSRDANHDGKMTAEEWTGGDPGRQAQFKKRDANGDGIVTKEEALDYGHKYGTAKKMMKEADKNHDGSLNPNEVQAYYASREGPPN